MQNNSLTGPRRIDNTIRVIWRETIRESVEEERPDLRAKIGTGLRVFAVITVVALLIILILTAKRETWQALKKVQPAFLIGTVVFWVLYLLFDGLRIQILSGALGRRVGIRVALKVIVSGFFLAAVTPFQTGGLPVQLYILRKEEISIGKGSLILLFRGVLELVVFIVAIPLIWFFYRSLLTGSVVRVLFRYLLTVYIGFTIFLLFLVFLPKTLKRLSYGLAFSLRRRKLVKSKKLLRGIKRLFCEVDDFRRGLKIYFSKRKLKLLGALSMTLISFVAYFMFAPMLLYGLGLHSSLVEIVVLQILLKYLLFFIPTPGASGIAEAGFASLFYQICPQHLLGVFVILWRFFTFYLGAGIGGAVVLGLLRDQASRPKLRRETPKTKADMVVESE